MALAAPVARSQSPDIRFREAQQKETVQGDLRGAIQLYQEVADAKASSRGLAAQALLRLGRCYEKLGNGESKKAYERLLRQYGDQVQIVGEARKRLAALSPAPAAKGELTNTLLFRLDEPGRSVYESSGVMENVATDGNSIFHFVAGDRWETLRTSALVATEISSGRRRELFKGRFYPQGLSLSPDGQQLAFSTVDIQEAPVEKESIYVIRTDGSNLRQIFTSASKGGQLVIMGTWSPNGNELVFLSRGLQDTNALSFRLNVISLKDGSVRTWKDLAANRLTYPNTLSYSPDGQFLAYDLPNEKENGARSIHVLRPGSSESSLLIGGPGSHKVLGWMPNGRELLFASDRRGTVDAYRVPVVEGKAVGEPALVRANIGSARPLGFRANGTFYFISEGLTRAVNRATFDPATGRVNGSPHVVTQRLVDWMFVPSWSPDGSTLVYAGGANSVRREVPVLTFRTIGTGEEKSVPLSPIVGGIAPGSTWSGDSQYLYVDAYMPNGEGGTIQVNPRSAEAKRIAPGHCHQPLPGEQALLCFLRDKAGRTMDDLQRYDLATGSMSPLKKGTGMILPHPPSPDGRFIFYAPFQFTAIRLLPLSEGEDHELVRAGSGETVYPLNWVGKEAVAYLRLRTAGPAAVIRNIDTGKEVEIQGLELSRLAIHNQVFPLMSVHPNGREIVWVSNEGKNELWALGNIGPAQFPATKK